MARYYSQPMISDIEIAARERLLERLQSVVPITKPHDPSNCVEAWNWLVEQAQQAASTIAAKEAEIAGLRTRERELADMVTKADESRAQQIRRAEAAQSEATRLRDGIQKLIDGDFAEQSVERVRDRLKALLEEADG